jgi:hypothetical protein
MRIATWNVEYARGLPKNERPVARIRQASAAIWVLTETHDVLGSLRKAVAATPSLSA